MLHTHNKKKKRKRKKEGRAQNLGDMIAMNSILREGATKRMKDGRRRLARLPAGIAELAVRAPPEFMWRRDGE